MQTKKHFKIFGSALALLCSLALLASSAFTGFAAESGEAAAEYDILQQTEEAAAEEPAQTEPDQEETQAITEAVINPKDTGDYPLAAAPDTPDPKLSNVTGGIRLEWAEVSGASQYLVCGTESGTNVWQRYTVDSPEYIFDKIESGKLYYFQVQALGADGSKSAFSSPRGMTYIAVPSLGAVSNTFETDGTLKLSWSAVKGANKYRIAKMAAGASDYEYIDVTTNSYTDKNVFDGNTYRYQVRAMYATPKNGTAYGWWSTSKSAQISVWPAITLSNASNGVTVKWNSVKNTARYFVYCKKATDTSWTRVTTNSLSHTFTNLQCNTLYYFQLYSDSISGKDGKFSKAKSITYIEPPVIKSVTSSGSSVNVSWKSVNGATSYQLAKKLSDAKNYEYIFVNGTSYVDSNIPQGKFCSYQVRAISNASGADTYGYWSNSMVGETFIKPDFTVSNKADGIGVAWDKIDNAASYTVYYKASDDAKWSSGETKENSFVTDGAQSGKLYFIQLRYTGKGGTKSPFSDVKSITFTQQGTLLSVTASASGVNLRWSPIEGVDYYVLEKYNETTNRKYYLTVENATKTTDAVVSLDQTYYYRVCGVHRESEWHKVYDNAAGAYSSQIRIHPRAFIAVNTALGEQGNLGYKYCNEMNKGKLDEWCAIFAGWSLKQAGFNLDNVGYSANVGVWCDNLYKNGTFAASGTYTPVMGDLIIFGTASYRSHIGIVVGVSNGKVITIEGNAAVPPSYSGEWMANSYVTKREYDLDSYRIYGYGKLSAKK